MDRREGIRWNLRRVPVAAADGQRAGHRALRGDLRREPPHPRGRRPVRARRLRRARTGRLRSEEHTSELQSLRHLVCRLLLEKKKKKNILTHAIIKKKTIT